MKLGKSCYHKATHTYNTYMVTIVKPIPYLYTTAKNKTTPLT